MKEELLPFPSSDQREGNKFNRCVITAPNEATLLSWYDSTISPIHLEAIRAEVTRRHLTAMVKSSTHLEKLTATLNRLTWALIILTVLGFIIAAGVPIGIEKWKSAHEPQTVPQSVPAIQEW
jgi:SNF family Na+-dependent transporter